MKFFHYRPPSKKPGLINFGDELNAWLWDKLIPGVLDENEETAFIGIGTLLNNLIPERVPNAKKIVVFSSGVGYNKGIPKIDDSWTIYCVRGPLSAKALGLSEDVAVTDGAALIRRVFQPSGKKVHKFAYMPHFTQSKQADKTWRHICEEIGFGYIDARWPIEKVMNAIAETEVLLTEAMHGAIVGDALRVPWIPIHTTERILEFKWQDWSASVGVEYKPHWLMEMRDLAPKYGIRSIRGIKGSRSAIRASFSHWFNKKRTAKQLAKIAKTVSPTLSSDRRIEELTVELETRLNKFKQDVEAGRFNLN